MKYLNTKAIVPSLVVLAIIGAVVSIPVLAKDGTDDSGSGTTSAPSSESNTTEQEGQSGIIVRRAPEVNPELEHQTEVKNRTAADSILAELKDKQGQKESDTTRRQNCENEKGGILTKATKLATNALRYQTKLDTALQQAEAFQKNNNLTIAKWDTLLATATTAQTKAVASVAALRALNITIDCTQPSVASEVATIKAAAGQARTDLIAYKQAVIALLTSLENAKGQGGN